MLGDGAAWGGGSSLGGREQWAGDYLPRVLFFPLGEDVGDIER